MTEEIGERNTPKESGEQTVKEQVETHLEDPRNWTITYYKLMPRNNMITNAEAPKG